MDHDRLPPHWYEGMLLRPQQFQALSRALRAAQRDLVRGSHPFPHGVIDIDLSADEVGNGRVTIRAAAIVFKNGTVVRIPDECAPPAAPFETAWLDEAGGALEVFLTLPLASETVPAADAPDSPFRIEARNFPDENVVGSSPQSVQLRSTNVRLSFRRDEAEDDSVEALRIARIRYSAEGEPELDPDFAPASLHIAAYDAVKKQLEDAVHFLAGKGGDLAGQLLNRKVAINTEGGELLLKLQVVNANLPALRQMLETPRVHPLMAYNALTRVIGELSVFHPELKLPDLAPYDHEAPAESLGQLLKILRSLWIGQDTRYHDVRSFTRRGDVLALELDDSWIDQQLDLYLGVQSPAKQDAIDQVVQNNVRLGAATQMEDFKRYSVRGVPRSLVREVPSVLPMKETLHFFKIERTGPYWDQCRSERNLNLGYYGQSEEIVHSLLKNSADDLFRLFVILRKEGNA